MRTLPCVGRAAGLQSPTLRIFSSFLHTHLNQSRIMSTVTEVKTTWRQLTFMKRKPGTTLEHFQKHWSTTHVQVVTALPIFREKVFRYEQVRPEPAL